jgi:hypothetical protein
MSDARSCETCKHWTMVHGYNQCGLLVAMAQRYKEGGLAITANDLERVIHLSDLGTKGCPIWESAMQGRLL